MNYRVLIVEDDNKLRNTMEDYLSFNGFIVKSIDNGRSAIETFMEENDNFDIVLLDGMLPEIDGFDVLKAIRNVSNVPVMIISARESEEYQLKGYHLGADNYITKPFLLSVLKEQINALLARTLKIEPKIKRGAIEIHTDSRKVFIDGNEIETTPKEYDVLLYMIKNEKHVLDRNTILDYVWGIDYYGDFRTVDTIIKQLRKKITNKYQYIKSVYGVGYYFEVDDD